MRDLKSNLKETVCVDELTMKIADDYEKNTCAKIFFFLNYHDYINNHNSKFELYRIVFDFKQNFVRKTNNEECCSHIKSELKVMPTKIYLKKFLKLRIEDSIQKGYQFAQLSEMCIAIVNPIRKLSYQSFLKQPKVMCETFSKRTNQENPSILNTLKKSSSHPFFPKFSYVNLNPVTS